MSDRRPVYLLCITADNHNKYYRMLPKSDGSFDVEFGRVGAACQHAHYPMSQWNKKYNEKIRKGYVDQTDLREDLIVKEKPKQKQEYRDIEDKSVAKLVERLQDMARRTIQSNYRVESEQVTQAMVDKAQEKIDELAQKSSDPKFLMRDFNDCLLDSPKDG